MSFMVAQSPSPKASAAHYNSPSLIAPPSVIDIQCQSNNSLGIIAFSQYSGSSPQKRSLVVIEEESSKEQQDNLFAYVKSDSIQNKTQERSSDFYKYMQATSQVSHSSVLINQSNGANSIVYDAIKAA